MTMMWQKTTLNKKNQVNLKSNTNSKEIFIRNVRKICEKKISRHFLRYWLIYQTAATMQPFVCKYTTYPEQWEQDGLPLAHH
jgi:hypothetical protein